VQIDTQSRADTYIRRIKVWMHLKVFMKLKKTLKTLSSGQINNKNPKKPTGVKKKPGFFQPCPDPD